MTNENKLPIPRMIEVRDHEDQEWVKRELIADLSGLGLNFPYICRDLSRPQASEKFARIREIPQPQTRPMTPRELLDAIRGGAVWRFEDYVVVARADWASNIDPADVELCYDWHGTDSDVWVKAEVAE